jgi:hypothetical protein
LFAGGFASGSGNSNVIQYVTIDTAGNATDFGDLTLVRNAFAGTSNGIRGVFAGGSSASTSNVIDYVTIATTGNATDFGDLTLVRSQLAGCSGT